MFVESTAVTNQLSVEQTHFSTLSGKFQAYARAWLLEYEQLQPALHPVCGVVCCAVMGCDAWCCDGLAHDRFGCVTQTRFVRVFARSDCGDLRCVCSFIQPMHAPQ